MLELNLCICRRINKINLSFFNCKRCSKWRPSISKAIANEKRREKSFLGLLSLLAH